MNLISDSWIPVITRTGHAVIRPEQIADANVLFPDWPRPDLNLACLELLIGLVFMACPPADAETWEEQSVPDGDRLRDGLSHFVHAFELGGSGPRFLQDLEAFEGSIEPNPVDMLFIDSSGGNTARNNADLMVHRNRYADLTAPHAAMALFALQAFAPSGGAGNRTSMRGGGPLTTLIIPHQDCSLYDIVWANVPDGSPAGPDDLPWMRPTHLSDKEHGSVAYPPAGTGMHVETFFGMPRRLRLIFSGNDLVTGVVQRPYGANYALWNHPLTPYYQQKAGDEKLPVHPRAGLFGYRNWLGIVCEADEGSWRYRAETLTTYRGRVRSTRDARLLVGGWAMDNMKPRDFLWSMQPLAALDLDKPLVLRAMIQAAEMFVADLRAKLRPVLGEKSALDSAVESFFQQTDASFSARFAELRQGNDVAVSWVADLRRAAMRIYDSAALNSFDQRDANAIEVIARGRNYLLGSFAGRGKIGAAAFTLLGLPLPAKMEKIRP